MVATKKSQGKARHIVEVLDDDFHSLQNKIGKARDSYLAGHQKELAAAKKKLKVVQGRLAKARASADKAAARAKKSSSETTKNQVKKSRAAVLLLGKSFTEAKQIMVTSQSKLHAAKPFDRKLAARAKVLAQFEKDWDKKMKAETVARAARAKKAAAKKKRKATLAVVGVANR